MGPSSRQWLAPLFVGLLDTVQMALLSTSSAPCWPAAGLPRAPLLAARWLLFNLLRPCPNSSSPACW